MLRMLATWWRENSEWFQILMNLERIGLLKKSNGAGASVFMELQKRHRECLAERDRMAAELQNVYHALDKMGIPRNDPETRLFLLAADRVKLADQMARTIARIIRYTQDPSNSRAKQQLVEWLDGLGIARFGADGSPEFSVEQRLTRVPMIYHDWVTRVIEDLVAGEAETDP